MKFLHTHQLQVAKTSSVITPLPSSRHPGQWLITLVSIHFGGLRLTVTTSEVAFLTKVRTYCGRPESIFFTPMATGPTGQTCKQSLLGGWPTPLKNDGVKVSWDDEIPNWMKSHNPFMFQSTNQFGNYDPDWLRWSKTDQWCAMQNLCQFMPLEAVYLTWKSPWCHGGHGVGNHDFHGPKTWMIHRFHRENKPKMGHLWPFPVVS